MVMIRQALLVLLVVVMIRRISLLIVSVPAVAIVHCSDETGSWSTWLPSNLARLGRARGRRHDVTIESQGDGL